MTQSGQSIGESRIGKGERKTRSICCWLVRNASPVPTNLMPQFARHSFSQQMWGANMGPPKAQKGRSS